MEIVEIVDRVERVNRELESGERRGERGEGEGGDGSDGLWVGGRGEGCSEVNNRPPINLHHSTVPLPRGPSQVCMSILNYQVPYPCL